MTQKLLANHETFADEGDLTKAGKVLVKMGTRDLDASLKQSQSLIIQAGKTLEAAAATLEQHKRSRPQRRENIEFFSRLFGQPARERKVSAFERDCPL